jgi:TonB-dependent starch-binding outer membrane protein SusC
MVLKPLRTLRLLLVPVLTLACVSLRPGRKILLVMKLTAIILLAAALQVSAKGIAQDVTITASNTPLENVFAQIKKQTHYNFVYANDVLRNAKNVTLEVRNLSIEETLKLIFKDQPLTYSVVDKVVVVKIKETATNTESPKGESHTETIMIDVKGRVTNEVNEPVEGASVTVKGTTNGTTTNAEGYFELKGVDEHATLIITSVSIEPREIKVEGKTLLAITAKTKVADMQEVVVRKGYYDEKRATTTGNVSTVTAKDIEKQPINNPLLALQGRVPGMEITQVTGLPGSGVRFEIRGRNSIQQGIDPLFIIDGVPYPSENPFLINGSFFLGYGNRTPGSPLSSINPADIESISVLKDADATAIYGSRGANGVVIITTKKGKAGQTRVNANVQAGIGQVGKKLKVLNTRQYLDMRNEAFRNDGAIPNPNADYDLTLWDTTQNTDWQKELIGKKAKYFDAQASFSGGNENLQYRFGAGYHYETTVFLGDFNDKKGFANININNTSRNNKFRIQVASIYSIDDNYLNAGDLTRRAVQLPPNAPSLYNADGSINWMPNIAGNSTWPGGSNPAASLNNKYTIKAQSLVANATLGYTISKDLEIKANFGYSNALSDIVQKQPLSVYDPVTISIRQRSSLFSSSKIYNWIIEPQLSFKRVMLKGTITALAGLTIQSTKTDGQSLSAEGFNSDAVMEDIKSATMVTVLSTANSVYKYNAVFSRLNYNYQHKYIINVTGRRDGSSRFGPAKQFQNFVAIGLGWVFSKEKFVQKSLTLLSYGKLRFSYGSTGSDQVSDYSFMDLYSPVNSGVPYLGGTAIYPNRIYTPDLEWEETRKLEVGIELGFLKDKIVFAANFYRNRSTNQLTGYSLPTITGFTSVSRNLNALIQNQGLEFELRTENIHHKIFVWTSNFNLSLNRNKLIAGADGLNAFYQQKIGYPVTANFVYHLFGVNPITGLYQIADAHGNPINNPTPTDATAAVDITPKFFGGFQNSLSYKNLSLDFLLQFVKRPQGINYLYNYIPGYFSSSSGGNQPVTVLDRWQSPGDVKPIQRFSQNTNTTTALINAKNSDQQYGDASFIRLKNLSISWQMPTQWIEKIRLQSARIYAQGQNLLTITKYKGLNSEEALGLLNLPPLRVVTIGVHIIL